jgi:DHA2 family multidrug resistance protein
MNTMAETATDKKDSLGWLVLLTVIIGTFLGRLDQTIVNLALPKIIDNFSVTISAAGWIATAYILANAVFVPICGKLGDTLGRKKVYNIGFVVFIIGSVLAGLSWNLGSLILFRIIQAAASSASYPTAMAIIAVTFKEGKQRAQALGIWSASFAAAAVLGPLIGGPLIDAFGWRSIFLINLPIGLIGLIMAMAFIKESVSEQKSKTFDWWGAIVLGGVLSALVLVLDKGMDWGWLSLNSFLSYAAVIIFTYIFILIEKKHSEPIVDFKFFKIPVFVNTLGNNFIVFMGLMGSVFLIPIFAQTFLGFNATQTGYLFIPMALMLMLASPIGGALTGKVEPRYVIAGSTLIAAIGLYLFSGIDPRSGPFDIILPLSVMAFGIGLGMAQRTNIITSAVPIHKVGIASSILALARNIAGALGIAIFGTILQNSTKSKLLAITQQSSINASTPLDLKQGITLMTLKAQIASYGTVFVIAAIILFIGALTALLIRVDNNKISKTDVLIK